MNKLKIILIIAAVFVIAQTVSAAAYSVRIKDNTCFVFKTDKKFIGATVEVMAANGDIISSCELKKRKIAIDFAGVRSGEYTIRVTKGKRIEEFYFEKR